MRFRCCLVALALLSPIRGEDISSFGDWTRSFNATDLSGGAGSDFPSQFESAAGGTTITVTNASGWRVLVRRASGTWDGNFTLSIKRTSAGSGSGSISGGTTYVALSTSDTELFAGSGDRSNVALQLKLTGLTRLVAPSTYTSSVIFTVLPQ